MNVVNICPEIPDNWKGGTMAVVRLLGICPKTLRRYTILGKSKGGIDARMTPNGRKYYTGKDVKQLWMRL